MICDGGVSGGGDGCLLCAFQLVMGDAGRMCFDLISSSSELTTDGRLRTYSLAIGGHKRMTGEAGIATISGIILGLQGKLRTRDWLPCLASLSSSRLGCDSRRFHSETT